MAPLQRLGEDLQPVSHFTLLLVSKSAQRQSEIQSPGVGTLWLYVAAAASVFLAELRSVCLSMSSCSLAQPSVCVTSLCLDWITTAGTSRIA